MLYCNRYTKYPTILSLAPLWRPLPTEPRLLMHGVITDGERSGWERKFRCTGTVVFLGTVDRGKKRRGKMDKSFLGSIALSCKKHHYIQR